MPISNPPTAAAVHVRKIGVATYDQLQEIHDLTRAAGHLDGGDISDAGSGNIAVTAGQGFIRAVNNDTSTLLAFDWPAPANIAIPDDSIRYVRVNYNAGSPIVTVSASEDYDYRTSFPLGFVVREGGTFYINNTPHNAGRVVGRLSRRNYEVDGRSRANALGGLIIGVTGTRNVSVSTGTTWLRGIREVFPGLDTAVSGSFDRYYRGAVPGTWVREAAQTQWPNTQYDDGSGTLQIMTPNRWNNLWFYLGPANGIIMVYGRQNETSQSNAEAVQPPGDLPLRLQVGAILLGRFVFQRDAATPAAIQSAFDVTFTATPVSDHGLLAGLLDDDHTQYHLRAEGVIRQVSAGTQAQTSGSVSFADSNGVTFGLNAGTVTASVAPGGGGLTNIRLSAGTTSNLLSAVTFGDANGVSFGINASTVTASHNGLTSQSNQNALAANGNFNFQTISFSNANGISFSTAAGSAIQASHNALTSQSNQAVSGQNGSFTFQTASFSNANGISFGTSAGPAITASHNALTTAAQSDHSHGNPQLNLTNLSGTTNSNSAGFTLSLSAAAAGGGDAIRGIAAGASTQTTNTVNFSNSNGVSFGFGAGANSTVITGSHNALTSQSNQAFSAENASSAFQTLTFQANQNFSFSNNAGAIRASHNLAGTSTGFTGVNISGSMTNNSSGLALSFSVAPGGGAGIGGIAVNASTTYTSGTVVFSAGPNITLNTNAQTISISAPNPGGGGPQTIAYFNNMGAAGSISYQLQTSSQGSLIVVPLTPLNDVFPGDITAATLGIALRCSATQSTAAGTYRYYFGIYTRNVSTLSLLNSVSTSITWANVVAATSSFTGDRWLTIHSTQWSSSPVFTANGRYWLGYIQSSSGATQGFVLMGQSFLATTGRFGTVGIATGATNSSFGHYPFMGRYTVQTSGFPNALSRSAISHAGAAGFNFIPQLYMYDSNGLSAF